MSTEEPIRYTYHLPVRDEAQLDQQIRDLQPPLPGFMGLLGDGDLVHALFEEALSAEDKARLDVIVGAHVPVGPRQPRMLYAIYVDIGGLTAGQLAAVWSDLDSGVPPKMALDTGPNAASIFCMQFVAKSIASLTAAEKNEARQRVMAMYTQDNTSYLIHPPFAPGVNIDGSEPIP